MNKIQLVAICTALIAISTPLHAQQQNCRSLSYAALHGYKGAVKQVTEITYKAITVKGQWQANPHDSSYKTTITHFDRNGSKTTAELYEANNPAFKAVTTMRQVTADSVITNSRVMGDTNSSAIFNTETWISDHAFRRINMIHDKNTDSFRIFNTVIFTLDKQCRIDNYAYSFPGIPDGDFAYKLTYDGDKTTAYKTKGKAYGTEDYNEEIILSRDTQGNPTRIYRHENIMGNVFIERSYVYY